MGADARTLNSHRSQSREEGDKIDSRSDFAVLRLGVRLHCIEDRTAGHTCRRGFVVRRNGKTTVLKAVKNAR